MGTIKYDVVVIGGGPAGLTAGIYLSRAKVKTLILNEGAIGGQMVLTHNVANYPGVEDISGYMLSQKMLKQAETFGCNIRSNIEVTNIYLSKDKKTIRVNGKELYEAKSVILATGSKSKELGVPGEINLVGKGISYCATCDGDFFQDKEIVVIGGGNSALEEAVSLTQYASKVTIIHQLDHFQAYEHAVNEAKNNPKINILMETVVTAFHGESSLEKITIKNIKTKDKTEIKTDGAFIFIGYIPQTDRLIDFVMLNKWGEIITDNSLMTNIPGVFAAGDAREKKIRQITTSVSDGTISALSAIEFLQKK